MSKDAVREDKTCLNCFHVVEKRFCPNCGQENVETRKTFHHIFVHFFEDLTHYENSFWKTIINLILKPASLTKEYLSGRRVSYLAPFRLYIFISFITFFLMSVLPNKEVIKTAPEGEKIETVEDNNREKIINDLIEKDKLSKKESDSLQKLLKHEKKLKSLSFGYNSIEEMDSIKKVNPEQISDFEYWLNKKTLKITDKNSKEEIFEKFKESFFHNIPKALFIYMPLFAFLLWLFNNKKRWYYFDHGIYTLHFFSFILLVVLILGIKGYFFSFFGNNVVAHSLNVLINLTSIVYMFYYFFAAHYRFYSSSKLKSFFKSSLLLIINSAFIFIILLFLVLYSFLNIH